MFLPPSDVCRSVFTTARGDVPGSGVRVEGGGSSPIRDAVRHESGTSDRTSACTADWTHRSPLPLGTTNPGWEVLVNRDGQERLYFVAETKSSLFEDGLRERESGKIKSGTVHFQALSATENPARSLPGVRKPGFRVGSGRRLRACGNRLAWRDLWGTPKSIYANLRQTHKAQRLTHRVSL